MAWPDPKIGRFVRLEGGDEILVGLSSVALKGKAQAGVNVVYDTPYAVYVHEDLTKYHAPPTQAKFLEQPARDSFIQNEIAGEVFAVLRNRKPLLNALRIGAQILLDESQKLVPVDTGRLKRSGRVEEVFSFLGKAERG